MIGADKEFYELLKTEGIPFELHKENKKYLISLQYKRSEVDIVKDNGLLISVMSQNKEEIIVKNFKNKKTIVFQYDLIKKIKNIQYGKQKKGVYYTESCSIVKNPNIPSADIERRKITKYIVDFCYKNKIALPIIWYFSDSKFSYSLTHDTDTSNDKDAEEIMTLENKYNLKSSFFIFEPSFSKEIIKKLIKKGFDVEQHPTLTRDLFLNLSRRLKVPVPFSSSLVKRFIKKTKGNRTHELLWFNGKEYADILKKNGVRWDSTFGYNSGIGYAFGTGLPYNLYGLIEFPIIIHDIFLLKKEKNYYKKFIENCIKNGYYCNFNIIYHSAKYLPKVFLEDLIKFMKKKDIEHIKLNDYHDFWQKRQNIDFNFVNNKIILKNKKTKVIILKLKTNKVKGKTWNVHGREFLVRKSF